MALNEGSRAARGATGFTLVGDTLALIAILVIAGVPAPVGWTGGCRLLLLPWASAAVVLLVRALPVSRLMPAARKSSATARGVSPVSRRVIRSVAAAAISAAAIFVLVPRLTGSPWQAISAVWSVLTWWKLALLSMLWMAGLLAHSTVLMGAMPGLTRRRAMTLNMTGSAVANVLPLGGGLGIGLNYVMVRRWGFSSGQFSLFTVLSNVWTVLAKAALPCLAVALLVARDVPIDQRILVGAAIGSTVVVIATAVALAIASSDRGARLAGRAAGLVPRRGRPRDDGAHVEERLVALRRSGAVIVRRSWRQMTLGMVTYYALGALLLWASLHVVGSTLGLVAVLALFAFERAVTTLPITPGGSGVAEVATTALAIAFSGPEDKAVVAAGVLLYRAITFGLEIPVGGAWLLGWLLVQRFGSRAKLTPTPALSEAA